MTTMDRHPESGDARDPQGPEDQPLDVIESLLIEVLEGLDEGISSAETLEAHPEHAEAVRRRLRVLGHLEMGGPLARQPPDQLGPWILEAPLGQGGMGEVWRGRHRSTGVAAALKFVRVAVLSESHAKRFEREASTLARLDHPGIVRLVDSGEAEGYRFIAMELLEGLSLRQWLEAAREKDGSVDVLQVVRWGHELALALDAAHHEGVVHRDIKPSNIQITPDGRAILIDFGLTRGVTRSSLSMSGRFVGSPHYAAPEQIRGDAESVGPLTDIYGLGVTLYEVLAQSPPFEGSSTEHLFHRILTTEPAPLTRRNPQIAAPLGWVVHRAMEKKARDRFRTAREFADDLLSVLELRPVSARAPGPLRLLRRWSRRRPAAAAALLVSGLALFAVGAWRIDQSRRERHSREAAAVQLLADANDEFDACLAQEQDLPGRVAEFEQLHRELTTVPFDPSETERLDRVQNEIEATQTIRERAFTNIMERLRLAESLDPTLAPEIDRLRARVYVEQWDRARNEGDLTMADFFAERVRSFDVGDDIAQTVDPRRTLTITSDPPGARIDGFYFQRLDRLITPGEPRQVAIPLRGLPGGREPGIHAIKVRHGDPPLAPEDVILELDGVPVGGSTYARRGEAAPVHAVEWNGKKIRDVGDLEESLARSKEASLAGQLTLGSGEVIQVAEVSGGSSWEPLSPREAAEIGGHVARVWRDGKTLDVPLIPGSHLRPTASPLYHGESSRIGSTPLDSISVDAGDLMLLVRAKGHDPVRVFAPLHDPEYHVVLEPRGRLPESFTKIYCGSGAFIMMDRELLVAEYAAYLEDDASAPLPPAWTRDPNGEVRPPDGARPDDAMTSVSHRDATRYAAWRTQRARDAGQPWTFTLPVDGSWQTLISAGHNLRVYPWGNHFRSHYTKSCFSRARIRSEPVLRFAVDETLVGIHDVAGSVSELCDGWFWPERGQRAVQGGSWVHANPDHFRFRFLWGAEENTPIEFVGFRLELTLDE